MDTDLSTHDNVLVLNLKPEGKPDDTKLLNDCKAELVKTGVHIKRVGVKTLHIPAGWTVPGVLVYFANREPSVPSNSTSGRLCRPLFAYTLPLSQMFPRRARGWCWEPRA